MVRDKLLRALGLALAASVALSMPAGAQDSRVEIGGTAGWNLSDGVTFDGIIAGDGAVYNGIGPKDAFSWSANIGFYASEQVEVGFLFSQQRSILEVERHDHARDRRHERGQLPRLCRLQRRRLGHEGPALLPDRARGHALRRRAVHGRNEVRRDERELAVLEHLGRSG